MNETIDIRKIKKVANAATAQESTGKSDVWNFLNADIRFGRHTIPDRAKEGFYLELWSLLQAGIDIRTTLELITAEVKKKKAKAVFNSILELVVSGSTLSSA